MFKKMMSFAAVAGLVLALAPAAGQADVIALDDVLDQTGSYNTTVDLSSHAITGEESVYLIGTMTYDTIDPVGHQAFRLIMAGVDPHRDAQPRWGKENNALSYGLWYPYPLYLTVDTELTTDESHEVVFKWSQTGANAGEWSYWFNPDLSKTEAEVAAAVNYPNDVPGHTNENQSPLAKTTIVESAEYYSSSSASTLVVDYTGFAIYTGDDTPFATGSAPLPGDANDNGFVDDDDLAILLSNWEQDAGTITTWALGDFTGNTDVDDDDLAVLLGNWTGPSPGGAAVPEPVSAVLLLIGAPLVARRRRRK